MPTSFPMANPWLFNEQVDDVKLNARITTPINDLAATVNTAAPAAVFPGQIVGTVSAATTATSAGTTETLHTALTLTVAGIVAGRNYFIEIAGRLSAASATTTIVPIHASQSAITTASPVVGTAQAPVTGGTGAFDVSYRVPWTPGASGTWNIQVGVKASSAVNATFGNGGSNAFLTVVAA